MKCSSPHSPLILPETVLDIFFSRIHGKPYHILDEQTTRQMHALGQLSPGLLMAIYAVTARSEHLLQLDWLFANIDQIRDQQRWL